MRGIGLILLLTSLWACGDDELEPAVVGGRCTSDRQCEDKCLQGGDFPEGSCTIPCNSDRSCPPGSHCIDREGGVCLASCQAPSDCRGGYTCKGRKNKGHGGDSLVCIGN